MGQLIEKPSLIQAMGKPPKEIQEFVGRVNTKTTEVSIARMISPPGWEEPGQTPEFSEYTVVLKGSLHAILKDNEIIAHAGQGIVINAGEWVRYRTPDGAEYISVCLHAFSPTTVHRDQ